jgi:glutamate formiminotransferase/formiminotetrahydrofolate cyclodeaminase
MAARFTLGRGRYAEQQDRMAEIIERAANRRSELLDLAERELHAYEPVLAAMRLPADDPEREARIREARGQAAEPPLAIARAAAEVAELAAETARAGNPNLVGDAVVGAVLAEAACRGAARLAEINLGDARTLSDVIKRAASAREEALA